MRKKGIGSGMCLLAILVAGCAQPNKKTDEEKAAALNVMEKIGEATTKAVDAQRELSMTSDEKVARVGRTRKALFSDVVSYDFYGNVEDIVREIAMKYQYGFEVYGKAPPEKVMTNVFVTKKPVIEVLKQIGYTSNVWLDIAVKKDVIELRYKAK